MISKVLKINTALKRIGKTNTFYNPSLQNTICIFTEVKEPNLIKLAQHAVKDQFKSPIILFCRINV